MELTQSANLPSKPVQLLPHFKHLLSISIVAPQNGERTFEAYFDYASPSGAYTVPAGTGKKNEVVTALGKRITETHVISHAQYLNYIERASETDRELRFEEHTHHNGSERSGVVYFLNGETWQNRHRIATYRRNTIMKNNCCYGNLDRVHCTDCYGYVCHECVFCGEQYQASVVVLACDCESTGGSQHAGE